jgi:hypothetical protein
MVLLALLLSIFPLQQSSYVAPSTLSPVSSKTSEILYRNLHSPTTALSPSLCFTLVTTAFHVWKETVGDMD